MKIEEMSAKIDAWMPSGWVYPSHITAGYPGFNVYRSPGMIPDEQMIQITLCYPAPKGGE